ncbi:MAG: histidine kinase dimerization/phosphoacceptor domain -containing protein [Candidatus Omnitrophota bacterium]
MRRRLIILTYFILLVTVVLLVDAAVDTIYFHRGTYLETLLLHVSRHELFTRGVLLVVFVSLGWVISGIIVELENKREELRCLINQLESGNQQMRATEQQLKAANQQLRADEQQLKAGNQQLRSSEQQLKAYSQQLLSTNQQLKASEASLSREIGERIKVEEALKAERDGFIDIFSSMKDGIFITSQDNRIVFANAIIEQEFGDWRGRVCYEYLNEAKTVCPWCKKNDVFMGKTVRWEWNFKKNRKTYELIDTPLKERDGSLLKLVVFRDITEHKKALEEIRDLAKFPSENPSPVLRVSRDQTVLYANKAGEPLLKQWEGRIGQCCLPQRWKQAVGDVLKKGTTINLEVKLENKDLLFSIIPVRDASYVNIYGFNVTELKSAEEKIIRSLKEKEVLLKEVHHRVKNNLQIISSLINLQSKNIKDRSARIIFDESHKRVQSMAMLHEKLYKTDNIARIDFKEYIQELVAHLFNFYSVNTELVGFQVSVDALDLCIDTAIPCGLIVTELVSNSLMHAFKGGRRGRIMISLTCRSDRKYILIIEDDGIGLPKDMDPEKVESLGLSLVTSLIEQLQGSVAVSREAGTRFEITFDEQALV